MNPAKPNRFNAYVVLVAVFLVGGVAGAAIGFSVAEERLVTPPGREHGKHWEKRREDAFARELDLTREQQRQVGRLMREQREARQVSMEAMFLECGDDLRAQKEALDAEIMALLTPSQQARYQELASEHGRRFLFDSRPRGHRHGRDRDRDRGQGPDKKRKKKHPGDDSGGASGAGPQ